jgi:hypothetical protein
MKKSTPPQVTDGEKDMNSSVASVGNSTSSVVGGFAIATVGLNIVMAGSMQLLWGMVNTL